jgi:hypothetical protein
MVMMMMMTQQYDDNAKKDGLHVENGRTQSPLRFICLHHQTRGDDVLIHPDSDQLNLSRIRISLLSAPLSYGE